MKKIFSLVLSTVLAFTSVSVYAGMDNYQNISDEYVTLNGIIEHENIGDTVTLIITPNTLSWDNEEDWGASSGREIVYFGEVDVAGDKSYTFNFKLPESGLYNAYISSKTGQVQKGQLLFIHPEKNREAIEDALEKTTETALGDVIKANMADLGLFAFEVGDITADAEKILFNELTGKNTVTAEEMREFGEKAILSGMINESLIDDFYQIEGLLLLEKEIFDYCDSEISRKVVTKMKNNKINSLADFDKYLVESTILTLANGGDAPEILTNALNKYSEKIGIENTVTNTISKAILRHGRFNNCDELVKFVASYKPSDGDTGSSGGGGFSGGGGSHSYVDKPGNNSYNGALVTTPGITQGEKENESESIKEFDVFADISGVEWAKKEITELYKKGVINGKSEELFFPNDKVTRAEAAKILMLAFEISLADEGCPFIDVDKNEWSYEYIRTAYHSGVVKGVTENTFGKEQPVTRQDLCVMLYRLMIMGNPELEFENEISSFKDSNSISDYAIASVGFMQRNGIVNGDEHGAFNPMATATRAETAKIVYNVVNFYNQSR